MPLYKVNHCILTIRTFVVDKIDNKNIKSHKSPIKSIAINKTCDLKGACIMDNFLFFFP